MTIRTESRYFHSQSPSIAITVASSTSKHVCRYGVHCAWLKRAGAVIDGGSFIQREFKNMPKIPFQLNHIFNIKRS